MNTIDASDKLELIALKDRIVSFSRLNANAIRYHHWHQCLEILYIEAGYGVVMTNHRHYTLRPGRLFFFPPFTLHKIMVEEQAASVYRRTIIHIDHNVILPLLSSFPRHYHLLHQLTVRDGQALVVEMENLNAWLDTLFSHYNQLGEKHELDRENVVSLLVSLFSMLPTAEVRVSEDEYRLSEQVMMWVEEHFMNKISLDNIAADLQKSKSYISRRFHSETGEKINEYITTYRLRKACELLLRTSLPINEIARQIGYAETTYFITAFKKGIGESPLQYRKHLSAADKKHSKREP